MTDLAALSSNDLMQTLQDLLGTQDDTRSHRANMLLVEIHRRLEQLATLRRVDTELTDTLNIQSVLSLALDAALRLSGSYAGFIALRDTGGGLRLRLAEVIGAYRTPQLAELLRRGEGLVGRVLLTGHPQRLTDVRAEPDHQPYLEGSLGQMVIPLSTRSGVLGVINLETRYPSAFTAETFAFTQQVAARIAVAIDNARLYERERAQLTELRDVYEQLSKLEQMKSDMIRIAAHDLGNPLGVVMGHTDLARIELRARGLPENDPLHHHLSVVEGAVARMRKITSDILSLERIERQARLPAKRVSLSRVTRDIYAEYFFQARMKDQTLELSLGDETVWARGDRAQLHEAMANLVSNAIKYTPDGGTIEIELADDGSGPLFEVHDDGYGIPLELQERLFEPFYRAVSQDTRDIEGTGLGLHLVRSIVERHGGRIHFDSTEGVGSTFGFTLPPIPDDDDSPADDDTHD